MATQAELIEALPDTLANLPNIAAVETNDSRAQRKLWDAVQELQANQLLIIQALKAPLTEP